MRLVTIRLTAIGGVNCPIARFIVSSTPNQTGSQLNVRMIGTRIGRNTRNIEMASSSMPAISIITMIIASIAASLEVNPSSSLANASNAPSVEPACAKMLASAMMIITTAEISADSTSTR